MHLCELKMPNISFFFEGMAEHRCQERSFTDQTLLTSLANLDQITAASVNHSLQRQTVS